jgi:putative membrane protein
MWVAGMALTLPMLLMVVWRWASAEPRIALRAEALTDRPATRPVPASPNRNA